jgi:hypothetical protein
VLLEIKDTTPITSTAIASTIEVTTNTFTNHTRSTADVTASLSQHAIALVPRQLLMLCQNQHSSVSDKLGNLLTDPAATS